MPPLRSAPANTGNNHQKNHEIERQLATKKMKINHENEDTNIIEMQMDNMA
jgi:hypothetical protein